MNGRDIVRFRAMLGKGNSSGGAQPDWNAAPGEPGHVLNRPFYKEHVRKVILEETEMPFVEGEGFVTDIAEIPPVGSTATTIWNGETYTSTVYDASALAPGVVIFGNIHAILGDEAAVFGFPAVDTGEPFMITCASMDGNMMLGAEPVDDTTALTLSVSVEGEIAHKIPTEYVDEATILVITNTVNGFSHTGRELNAAYDAHKLVVIKSIHDTGASVYDIVASKTMTAEDGKRYYLVCSLIGGNHITLIVDNDDMSFSSN